MSDIQNAEAPKVSKSIVSTKYAGAYKGGGKEGDELAAFINRECKVDGKFDYDKFFTLAARNGIPTEKIDVYKAAVDAKAHGSQGRARMTLRNMLETVARKQGSLVDNQGDTVPLNVPKRVVTGAARKQQETASAAE